MNGENVAFRDAVRWIRIDRFGHYSYRETLDDSIPRKTVNILHHDMDLETDEISLACFITEASIAAANQQKQVARYSKATTVHT